jgi:Flp pilus assembly protein TadD
MTLQDRGKVDQALAAYREAVGLGADTPLVYRRLTELRLQAGRVEEAVASLERLEELSPGSQAAITLRAQWLQAKGRTGEIEPLVQDALKRHGGDPEWLYALAGLGLMQQRPDEALALYRRVLTIRPNHLPTMNNIATLLAEQPGQSQEALRVIEQAIQLVGQQAPLLDTKGMVLLHAGRVREAVRCLEAAAASARPDPRYSFHLAVAYDRLGCTDKAREALRKARQGDLDQYVLTAGDRKLLAEIESR